MNYFILLTFFFFLDGGTIILEAMSFILDFVLFILYAPLVAGLCEFFMLSLTSVLFLHTTTTLKPWETG